MIKFESGHGFSTCFEERFRNCVIEPLFCLKVKTFFKIIISTDTTELVYRKISPKLRVFCLYAHKSPSGCKIITSEDSVTKSGLDPLRT